MALISCPGCGRQVSDRAPQCPQCGYPIAAAAAETPEYTEVYEPEPEPKQNGRLKIAAGVLAVVAAVVGFMIYSQLTGGERAVEGQARQFVQALNLRNFDTAREIYPSMPRDDESLVSIDPEAEIVLEEDGSESFNVRYAGHAPLLRFAKVGDEWLLTESRGLFDFASDDNADYRLAKAAGLVAEGASDADIYAALHSDAFAKAKEEDQKRQEMEAKLAKRKEAMDAYRKVLAGPAPRVRPWDSFKFISYALYDLSGDGIPELFVDGVCWSGGDGGVYTLSIYTANGPEAKLLFDNEGEGVSFQNLESLMYKSNTLLGYSGEGDWVEEISFKNGNFVHKGYNWNYFKNGDYLTYEDLGWKETHWNWTPISDLSQLQ